MADTGGREMLLKIVVATIWMPIQIVLSLLFATGGLFLVVMGGIIFSPFVALFFLVRWTLRREGAEPTDQEDEPTSSTGAGTPLR